MLSQVNWTQTFVDPNLKHVIAEQKGTILGKKMRAFSRLYEFALTLTEDTRINQAREEYTFQITFSSSILGCVCESSIEKKHAIWSLSGLSVFDNALLFYNKNGEQYFQHAVSSKLNPNIHSSYLKRCNSGAKRYNAMEEKGSLLEIVKTNP